MNALLATYYINERKVSAETFWVSISLLVLLWAFYLVGRQYFGRRRIERELAARGCEVLDIRALGFWANDHRNDRDHPDYLVSYRLPDGKAVEATCRAGWIGDVEWFEKPRAPQSTPVHVATMATTAGTDCPHCGTPSGVAANFCAQCGGALKPSATAAKPHDRPRWE